jgi:hypothetical protein
VEVAFITVEGGLRAGPDAAESRQNCWLCARPLGRRVEWHHPVPKSCGGGLADLRAHPGIAAFLRWIAGKPRDFHVRTASGKLRR